MGMGMGMGRETYRTTFAPSSRSEKKIQSSLGGFFFLH